MDNRGSRVFFNANCPLSIFNCSLRRLRHGGLLFAGQEAEQLHFDDARVVAGLDAQDALEDDFLDEEFLVDRFLEIMLSEKRYPTTEIIMERSDDYFDDFAGLMAKEEFDVPIEVKYVFLLRVAIAAEDSPLFGEID